MATITVCDICGERVPEWDIRHYRIKVKRQETTYPDDRFWHKYDICGHCQDKIIEAIKLMKLAEGEKHV